MANTNIANPAPLGLAAFGVTTILLSSANAGLWGAVGAGAAVPTALFYGGLTQLLAGMWEFMRGSTFGATVTWPAVVLLGAWQAARRLAGGVTPVSRSPHQRWLQPRSCPRLCLRVQPATRR